MKIKKDLCKRIDLYSFGIGRCRRIFTFITNCSIEFFLLFVGHEFIQIEIWKNHRRNDHHRSSDDDLTRILWFGFSTPPIRNRLTEILRFLFFLLLCLDERFHSQQQSILNQFKLQFEHDDE